MNYEENVFTEFVKMYSHQVLNLAPFVRCVQYTGTVPQIMLKYSLKLYYDQQKLDFVLNVWPLDSPYELTTYFNLYKSVVDSNLKNGNKNLDNPTMHSVIFTLVK